MIAPVGFPAKNICMYVPECIFNQDCYILPHLPILPPMLNTTLHLPESTLLF